MKKLNKCAAVLTAGAMLMCFSSTSAGAVLSVEDQLANPYISETFPVIPEEYEKIEDYGVLASVAARSGPYSAYYLKEDHETYLVVSGFQQSTLILSKSGSFDDETKAAIYEIYEKYSDALAYDCIEDGNVGIGMYDHLDEDGNPFGSYEDYDDPSELAAKEELLREMCEEMYAAEVIDSAVYTAYFAKASKGAMGGNCIRIYNAEVDEEMLMTALKEINDNLAITSYENGYVNGEYYGDFYYLDHITGVDQMLELAEVIRAYYPNAVMTTDNGQNDISYYAGTIKIDLLEGITAPEVISYGDVNQDGRISVLDAIYMSKATAQVVSMNTDQITTGDCNGDGVVDAEDINLLLMYLVEKIDTLPVSSKT